MAGAEQEAPAEEAGELPFTGFPLWAIAAIGVLLLASGAALRRAARSR